MIGPALAIYATGSLTLQQDSTTYFLITSSSSTVSHNWRLVQCIVVLVRSLCLFRNRKTAETDVRPTTGPLWAIRIDVQRPDVQQVVLGKIVCTCSEALGQLELSTMFHLILINGWIDGIYFYAIFNSECNIVADTVSSHPDNWMDGME